MDLSKPIYMHRFFLLISFVITSTIVLGKNIPKTPFLTNYNKKDYKASTQNWDIVQDSKNRMYFGNNQGVLQFDGTQWERIAIPNKSNVLSLCRLGNDTILVGAYAEIGLIYHNQKGVAVYESWFHKIPDSLNNFDEVWRIHTFNDKIYFQSFSNIFVFEHNEFKTFIKSDFPFKYSFLVDGTLYIQVIGKGLHKLVDDSLVFVNLPHLFEETEIWSVFKMDDDNLLIGTQFDGFFVFDGISTKRWDTEANRFILENNLFSALHMKNGNFVFGSIQNGMIITNEKGQIQTILNTVVGLQNNTVLSLFEDESENVWVGLDNGIDYVKTNSPFTYVRKNGGFGTGYTSIVYNNILYTGTNQGLYYVPLTDTSNDYLASSNFNLIENTRGQVWSLCLLNKQLYCGHNSGLYLIEGTVAKRIGDIVGVWDIQEIPNNSDDLLIGTYEGFYLLKKASSALRKVKGFNESSRRFIFDSKRNILLSHGYKGVFYMKSYFEKDSIAIIDFYNGSKYLPAHYGNEIYKFNNEIITVTENGIYKFMNQQFIYDQVWDKFFANGSKGVTNIIPSGDSKYWCFKDGYLSQLTYLNENMFDISSEEFLTLAGTFPRNFENVYKLTDNSYLIGNEDGFVLYENKTSPLGRQKIILSLNTVFSPGNGKNPDLLPYTTNKEGVSLGELSYLNHSLSFNLSQPSYFNQNLVKFRYRINGGPWVDWQDGNILLLQELKEGEYFIDVQNSINTKDVSGELKIHFNINPPIYRSWYAYTFYLILFFSLSLFISHIIKRRIEYEKRLEGIRQQKKMIQKEIKLKRRAEQTHSELVELRNEKLRVDIRHKSKELANTTMNIIHKNKILQQIVEVLAQLTKEDIRYRENAKINSLIRKINKEIENQDNWVVFEKNFDKVHENFLRRLKETHSDLTPKDLRLAAYLRMNLSSKEIAPLLNISVRSVEISRYRLRKKMDLEHDQNLTEYIIGM